MSLDELCGTRDPPAENSPSNDKLRGIPDVEPSRGLPWLSGRARAVGERSSRDPGRRAPVAARCCASADASTEQSKLAPYDLLRRRIVSPAVRMVSLDELRLIPPALPRDRLCIVLSMAPSNDKLRRIPDVEPSRDLPWLSGLAREAGGERSSWGPGRRAARRFGATGPRSRVSRILPVSRPPSTGDPARSTERSASLITPTTETKTTQNTMSDSPRMLMISMLSAHMTPAHIVPAQKRDRADMALYVGDPGKGWKAGEKERCDVSNRDRDRDIKKMAFHRDRARDASKKAGNFERTFGCIHTRRLCRVNY